MAIVVGDLHAKSKEPYRSAIKSFFGWLLENYKDEEIVFLGDIFDNSSPHADIELEIIEFISQFKHSHLITGNHDRSDTKGNTLLPHIIHKNISIYEDVTEIELEGNKCLILPFRNDNKKYELLEGKFDFIFTHIMPKEFEFASEGLEFKNLRGCFIHGHHHSQEDYTDTQINQHCILGVPLETRNGEQQKHRILGIKEGKIKTINVPLYFTHETISYGEEPTSKNNILNIIDAPNKKLVFEKYRGYYIREAGIKLLRTENTKETFSQEFDKANILQKFKKYSIEKNISKEVNEECSTRLSMII
jgi:calcineurin-like phosphoesterase family protein